MPPLSREPNRVGVRTMNMTTTHRFVSSARSLLVLVAAVVALATPGAGAQTCTGGWLPGQGMPGLDGPVYASAAWDPDGSGPLPPQLVVGGSFHTAGDQTLNNVALWDGTRWKTLGNTGPTGGVSALAVYNGDLYVGGSFTAADGGGAGSYGRIARLVGGSWQLVGGGTGFNGAVLALTVHNGELVAGGSFTSVDDNPVNRVAAWNGSTWRELGTGIGTGSVYSLASHNGALFVGGQFSTAGGSPAAKIATWNGSAWSQPGPGFVGGDVNALIVHGGSLYAAGGFITSGGVTVNRVARWDGAAWLPLGTGANGLAYSLGSFGGRLLIGGNFTAAGGVTLAGLAQWDGSAWSAVSTGIANSTGSTVVYTLLAHAGELIIGGTFNRAGDITVARIATWSGTAWGALGSGFNDQISEFTIFNGKAVAVGAFQATDQDQTCNRIGSWDGSAWRPFGTGMNALTSTVAVHNNELYAAGQFTTAGGVPANRVARWDGSAWNPLGTGMALAVYTLASYNGGLYAGGLFTAAGGVTASHVARWDGSAWSALGAGVNGNATAMCVYNNELVVGGAFTQAGGSAASNIARWNGTSWQPLGGGLNNQVNALALYNGQLIAGGNFTTADGATVNYIASWDGSAWHDLGGGFDNVVNALTVYRGRLIAGGAFTSAGGGTFFANKVATWYDGFWLSQGFGVGGTAYALQGMDSELLVAGSFTTADSINSVYLARWSNDGIPWIAAGPPATLGVCSSSPSATLTCTPASQYGSLTFQWRRNAAPLSNLPGHIAGVDTSTLTLTGIVSDDVGSYDCVITGICGGVTSAACALSLGSCCPADLDDGSGTGLPDGAVTIDDLLFFLAHYEGGC